jgi:hypothetical protein
MARAAPVALRGELAPGEAGQRWRAADSCLRTMWGGAALAEGDQRAVPGVPRTSEQLWFSGGGATREEASSTATASSGRKGVRSKGRQGALKTGARCSCPSSRGNFREASFEYCVVLVWAALQ